MSLEEDVLEFTFYNENMPFWVGGTLKIRDIWLRG